MSKPFGVSSDHHFHSFTAFATVNDKGVNSRLQSTLDAMREHAAAVKAAGGNKLFLAGDTFHKRGEVAPSVLNPVMDLFRELVAEGFEIYVIPGNHDLERNESMRVGNAVTALEALGVVVAHETYEVPIDDGHSVFLFPWYAKVEDLIAAMKAAREQVAVWEKKHGKAVHLDAVIHAPIDGVLPHLPEHGLTHEGLSGTGFNRVLCGHYHHHRHMGDEVYSVGALTHQTWGDVNSKAGYLIVTDDQVKHYETTAPKFMDVDNVEDEEGLLEVNGNFVRVKIEVATESELETIRLGLLGYGAAGVVIHAMKKTVMTRATTPAPSGGHSIENSIKEFVTNRSLPAAAHALCVDILKEAQAA